MRIKLRILNFPVIVISFVFLLGARAALAVDLYLPDFAIEKLNSEKWELVGVPEKVGAQLPLNSKITLKSLDSRQTVGTVLINSKQKGVTKIDDGAGANVNTRLSNYLWFFYGIPREGAPYTILSVKNLSVKGVRKKWLSAFPRPTFPFVRVVDKKEVQSLLKVGAKLVDVTSLRERTLNIKRIPKSLILPFVSKAELSSEGGYGFGFNNFNGVLRGNFDNASLYSELKAEHQKNRNAKLIVHCDSDRSPECPRALLFLRYNGFKNIYWYHKGTYDWYGFLRRTPTKIHGVEVVDKEKVEILLREPHLFLDIREKSKYENSHIVSAMHLRYPNKGWNNNYYTEKTYPRTLKDMPESLKLFNPSHLSRYKDLPVVVYAWDDSRWTSYRAVIHLRDSGFKNVKFYRAGLSDWIANGGKIISSKKAND